MKLLFLAFGYVAAQGGGLLCRAPQLVIYNKPRTHSTHKMRKINKNKKIKTTKSKLLA